MLQYCPEHMVENRGYFIFVSHYLPSDVDDCQWMSEFHRVQKVKCRTAELTFPAPLLHHHWGHGLHHCDESKHVNVKSFSQLFHINFSYRANAPTSKY